MCYFFCYDWLTFSCFVRFFRFQYISLFQDSSNGRGKNPVLAPGMMMFIYHQLHMPYPPSDVTRQRLCVSDGELIGSILDSQKGGLIVYQYTFNRQHCSTESEKLFWIKRHNSLLTGSCSSWLLCKMVFYIKGMLIRHSFVDTWWIMNVFLFLISRSFIICIGCFYLWLLLCNVVWNVNLFWSN